MGKLIEFDDGARVETEREGIVIKKDTEHGGETQTALVRLSWAEYQQLIDVVEKHVVKTGGVSG